MNGKQKHEVEVKHEVGCTVWILIGVLLFYFGTIINDALERLASLSMP